MGILRGSFFTIFLSCSLMVCIGAPLERKLSFKTRAKLLLIRTATKILPKKITLAIPVAIFSAGTYLGASLAYVYQTDTIKNPYFSLKVAGIAAGCPLVAIGGYLVCKHGYAYCTRSERFGAIKKLLQRNRKSSYAK